MALALVANIRLDPFQILGAKADHAVPRLPLEHLPTNSELLAGVVRERSLQLADELGNRNRRGDREANVDVRFDAADLVDVDAGRVDALAAG